MAADEPYDPARLLEHLDELVLRKEVHERSASRDVDYDDARLWAALRCGDWRTGKDIGTACHMSTRSVARVGRELAASGSRAAVEAGGFDVR